MPSLAFSKRHLRRMAILGAACAAFGCGDAELAQPLLGVRAAQAQTPTALPQQAVVQPGADTVPAAADTGAAALHSYREDVDPSHASIASYRD